MFDFDISKLMVVAIVALAVIPPKDLPRVMRTVGQALGKMRRMAAEFQGQFMDAMKEADLDSVRKELEALNEKAKVEADLDGVRKEFDALNEQVKAETAYDPAVAIRDEVTRAAADKPQEIHASEVGASAIALEAPPEPAHGAAEPAPAEPLPAEAPPVKQSAAE
jgi:sec-independent protein translocase protein TatB